MSYLRHKLYEQEGATAVEYGIMVALIAVVIIVAVSVLGTNLNQTFTDVNECMTGNAEDCAPE